MIKQTDSENGSVCFISRILSQLKQNPSFFSREKKESKKSEPQNTFFIVVL